jgi:hypothetical protein
MMISPAGASPYAAAAALDRQLRSGDDAGTDDGSGAAPDSGPDVVVTLGQRPPAASTYDASGKLAGPPPDAPTDDAPDNSDDATSTSADEDAAVPA